MKYDPIFERFKGFSGVKPAGQVVDFLGVFCDEEMLEPGKPLSPEQHIPGVGPLNCTGDGYFDLIAVLRSVEEAKERFVMIELGAGYGYWISQGALAARQRGLPFHLTGVEAEPTHYDMMLRHLRNNGVDPADHTILHAAVTMKGGEAWFQTGKPHEWWGQEVIAHPESYTPPENSGLTQVRAVSLPELLAPHERIDLVHMDVQGLERDVLGSALEMMNAKVRRVIVGTHSEWIEGSVRELMAGWVKEFDFPMSQTHQTVYGPVSFGDGVQIYSNPALGAPYVEKAPARRLFGLLPPKR